MNFVKKVDFKKKLEPIELQFSNKRFQWLFDEPVTVSKVFHQNTA